MRRLRLYIEILKLAWRKFVLRQPTGLVLRKFATKMGVAYVKFAQILAMQNVGEIFTEEDRRILSTICDNLKPVPFRKIKHILWQEYPNLPEVFTAIEERPLGSASVSQVHKAILKSGETVAVKIKRRDVEKHINRDIKIMKRLVYRYGGLFGFKNFSGGDKALDFWLRWIREETDFEHECENIEKYRTFANSVNGKIRSRKQNKHIILPQLFLDKCTKNIIVMEYIPYKTINQLELTPENKRRINMALNSYLELSFYAMFHDLPIVFHGDPHGGNIYLDDDGNIGFLDMGLLAAVPAEETELLISFFLAAYSGDPEQIYQMLVSYGKMSPADQAAFHADCIEYSQKIHDAPIPHYFVDMMNIVLKYDFLPPDFLFSMAKAFVCLYGIDGFSNNLTPGSELVRRQVTEYLIRRGVKDLRSLASRGVRILPEAIYQTFTAGPVDGAVTALCEAEALVDDTKTLLTHCRESLALVNR